MFLVVFVTVVISIIGVLAQVLSLQSARMNNSQIGLMQTLVAWHHSATNAAFQFTAAGPAMALQYATAPHVGPANATDNVKGCMMDSTPYSTKVAAPANLARPVSCVNPIASALFQLTPGTTLPNGTLALPPGYQINPYSFHSIFFKRTGLDWVVTYIPVPAVATNYLSLPDAAAGNPQIGYTIGDLQRQFARVANYSLSYGFVKPAGNLHVQPKGGTAIDYPIPATVPLNSFAIISLAQ